MRRNLFVNLPARINNIIDKTTTSSIHRCSHVKPDNSPLKNKRTFFFVNKLSRPGKVHRRDVSFKKCYAIDFSSDYNPSTENTNGVGEVEVGWGKGLRKGLERRLSLQNVSFVIFIIRRRWLEFGRQFQTIREVFR